MIYMQGNEETEVIIETTLLAHVDDIMLGKSKI